MLQTLKIGSKEFKIDPETNFWGIGPDRDVRVLFEQVRNEILPHFQAFRFSTDVLLLYVNPTDACNAHCPYCYLPAAVKSRGASMRYSELENLMQRACEYFGQKGIKGSVVFHGTEPLMIKETLFSIIDVFGKDIHFGIQTNAMLLEKEDIAFLRQRDVRVGVSLDSPFVGTNDALRGVGHFDKAVQALDWFDGYKGLNVVTTITSKNVGDLAAMVRFLHDHNVGLCLMNPVRGTQKGARALRPDCGALAVEFIRAVEEAIRLTKAGRRIVVGDFANILLGIVAPSARVMMCDISPCGGGRRFFSITADGSAYPCGEFIGMEAFLGGNVLRDSISTIVASENFAKVRERTVEKIPQCDACALRNICGAPCPAEIHADCGTMYAKSPYCDFYQKVAAHAFEVIYRQDVYHVLRRSSFRTLYSMESLV